MNLNEINPHEILEVEPGASRPEIERAYYIARLAYGSEALASYSLYSPGEKTAIMERIDRAYRMLTQPAQPASAASEAATFGDAPPEDTGMAREESRPVLAVMPGDQLTRGDGAGSAADLHARRMMRGPRQLRPIPGPFRCEASDVPRPYDAPTLRKVRESRGIRLEDISARTKISLKNLKGIESGEYAELPPIVYLRGYLAEFARSLRLHPAEVTQDYLAAAAGNGYGSAQKHE